MLTSQMIKEKAKALGADLCGIGDIKLFEGTNPHHDPRQVLPRATCVVGFGFRVLRSLYQGMQQGNQSYPYTIMGVKCMDEEVSEMFLLKMAGFIEDKGYDACIQRNVSNLKVKGDKSTNPEVLGTYELEYVEAVSDDVVEPEVILDFAQCAQICGLGSISKKGNVLTPKFGPYVRFLFLITDAPLELDEQFKDDMCDNCGLCAEVCPGHAIDMDAGLDTWQCSVYYRGAHKSNPYITDEFLKGNPEREQILNGEKRFDKESARVIHREMDFLPHRTHMYTPCLCGKACDVACYQHLKERGKL